MDQRRYESLKETGRTSTLAAAINRRDMSPVLGTPQLPNEPDRDGKISFEGRPIMNGRSLNIAAATTATAKSGLLQVRAVVLGRAM